MEPNNTFNPELSSITPNTTPSDSKKRGSKSPKSSKAAQFVTNFFKEKKTPTSESKAPIKGTNGQDTFNPNSLAKVGKLRKTTIDSSQPSSSKDFFYKPIPLSPKESLNALADFNRTILENPALVAVSTYADPIMQKKTIFGTIKDALEVISNAIENDIKSYTTINDEEVSIIKLLNSIQKSGMGYGYESLPLILSDEIDELKKKLGFNDLTFQLLSMKEKLDQFPDDKNFNLQSALKLIYDAQEAGIHRLKDGISLNSIIKLIEQKVITGSSSNPSLMSTLTEAKDKELLYERIYQIARRQAQGFTVVSSYDGNKVTILEGLRELQYDSANAKFFKDNLDWLYHILLMKEKEINKIQ